MSLNLNTTMPVSPRAELDDAQVACPEGGTVFAKQIESHESHMAALLADLTATANDFSEADLDSLRSSLLSFLTTQKGTEETMRAVMGFEPQVLIAYARARLARVA